MTNRPGKPLIFLLVLALGLAQLAPSLPAHAADKKGPAPKEKIVSGPEYKALTAAYVHAQPLLLNRKNLVIPMDETQFLLTEEVEFFRILITSTNPHVRGGDLEYWVRKDTFEIVRFKQWK